MLFTDSRWYAAEFACTSGAAEKSDIAAPLLALLPIAIPEECSFYSLRIDAGFFSVKSSNGE